MSRNHEDLVILRMLVRRGFIYDLAQLMIRDLVVVIDSLEVKSKTLKGVVLRISILDNFD